MGPRLCLSGRPVFLMLGLADAAGPWTITLKGTKLIESVPLYQVR